MGRRRYVKLVALILVFLGSNVIANAAPPSFDLPDVPSDAVPTVTSTVPETGDTEVSIDAGNVKVVFNGNNLSIDLTKDYEITKEGSVTDISGVAAYDEASKTLTIPYAELEEDTIYEVALPHNIITEDGNPMDDDYSWHFSTGSTPIPPNDDDEPEADPEDDDPPPPEEDPDDPPPPGDLKITDHSVWPKGFNPILSDTKISYEVSEDAIIKVKILNDAGVTVVTLIDDEEIDAGEYEVWWNGTDSTDDDGEVVSGGTYNYKILASDPESEELQDSETGTINVVYTVSEDFEGEGDVVEGTDVSTPEADSDQNAAILAMQSTTEGSTSDTGPSIFIYSFLPLGGLLIRKKWKK